MVIIEAIDVCTKEGALETVKRLLDNAGYKWIRVIRLNEDRHYKINATSPIQSDALEETFYLKWESELFHLASDKVAGLKSTGTRGACTLNIEYARLAFTFDAQVLIANKEDYTIYAIPAKEFWKRSYEYVQEQNEGKERVMAIAVEDLKPWDLLPPGAKLPIFILECQDCGYKHVQSKQDVHLTELTQILAPDHAKTFSHTLRLRQTTRSDPEALELRDKLVRWERW